MFPYYITFSQIQKSWNQNRRTSYQISKSKSESKSKPKSKSIHNYGWVSLSSWFEWNDKNVSIRKSGGKKRERGSCSGFRSVGESLRMSIWMDRFHFFHFRSKNKKWKKKKCEWKWLEFGIRTSEPKRQEQEPTFSTRKRTGNYNDIFNDSIAIATGESD